MREWSAKVGRSTRILEGLERGEQVGPKTITLVADGLGIDPDVLFRILELEPAMAAGRSEDVPVLDGEWSRRVGRVVAQWYRSAPASRRGHAFDLLMDFIESHPHGGVDD
jgi:hypothetical protein